MALAKASETDFTFPVFGFIPDGEDTGWPHIWALLTYDRALFKMDIYPGMELIDSGGRRWITRAAHRVREQAPKRWWHVWPLKPHSWYELELDIEAVEPVTFAELRERLYVGKERSFLDPGIGYSDEEKEERLAEVRAAQSGQELYDVFGFFFEPGFWYGR